MGLVGHAELVEEAPLLARGGDAATQANLTAVGRGEDDIGRLHRYQSRQGAGGRQVYAAFTEVVFRFDPSRSKLLCVRSESGAFLVG